MVLASSFDMQDGRARDDNGNFTDRSNQPMPSTSSNQEEVDSTQEEDMKNLTQQKLKPKIPRRSSAPKQDETPHHKHSSEVLLRMQQPEHFNRRKGSSLENSQRGSIP